MAQNDEREMASAMGWRPTTAFVLAAGLGTRMRHLTRDLPKPLVSVAGRALIDHVLDRIADAGIPKAVVNVHYKADLVAAALAGRTRPAITISDERGALLDTGGGIVKALPLIEGDACLVHNSDCIWQEGATSNLARLCDAFDPDRMDALLLLTTASGSIGYDGAGDFTMPPDGRLARRLEGMTAPFVFTGASIAHRRLFDGAPAGAFSLNRPWTRAIDRGRLFGVRMEGTWMHVGTPEALAAADALIRARHGG